MKSTLLVIRTIGIGLLASIGPTQVGVAATTTAFASATVLETATITQLTKKLTENAFGGALVLDENQVAGPAKTSINLLFELDAATSTVTYVMSNSSSSTYSFSLPAQTSTSIMRSYGSGKQVPSSLSDLAYTLGSPSSSITFVSRLNEDTLRGGSPQAGNYNVSIDYN